MHKISLTTGNAFSWRLLTFCCIVMSQFHVFRLMIKKSASEFLLGSHKHIHFFFVDRSFVCHLTLGSNLSKSIRPDTHESFYLLFFSSLVTRSYICCLFEWNKLPLSDHLTFAIVIFHLTIFTVSFVIRRVFVVDRHTNSKSKGQRRKKKCMLDGMKRVPYRIETLKTFCCNEIDDRIKKK